MKKLSLLLMGGCLFGLSVVGCKESAPSNNRYVNKWIGRQVSKEHPEFPKQSFAIK